MHGDHEYWDGLADLHDGLPTAWRRQPREEHLALISAWVGTLSGTWLKTDLFEERSANRALLPHLADADWIGNDVSPAIARAAQRTGVLRSIAADVRALPFADGSVDGVLSTSTLDHFTDHRDIDRALGELRRVLAPGGSLLVTFDNPGNPLIRVRNALPHRVARRTGLVPFSVGATHDLDSGRAALERAGFTVRRTTHLLHAPHIVGTRLAAWPWYPRAVLPRFARLAGTRLASRTGHFVAFLASAAESHPDGGPAVAPGPVDEPASEHVQRHHPGAS